jgi:acyl-CoA thioester hydrolase
MTRCPLVTYRTEVPADWVDYNGHLNIGYYMIAFDRATDGLNDAIGCDAAYRSRTGHSFYVVDAHLTFAREVLEGTAIRIESRIIASDDKRLQFFHRMIAEADGFLAATAEMLVLHVDLATRRAAPFPPGLAASLAGLAAAHSTLPPPPELGRSVSLRRRPRPPEGAAAERS